MLDRGEANRKRLLVEQTELKLQVLELREASRFCSPKCREQWEKEVDNLEFIGSFLPKEERDSIFRSYTNCSQVLNAFENSATWGDLSKLVALQEHTPESLVDLTEKIYDFSVYGKFFSQLQHRGIIKPTVVSEKSTPVSLTKAY